MNLVILGAAGGEVTGSAYLVESGAASVLVDCGMFQGSRKLDALNRSPVRLPGKLNAVLLTHAHLDHTGRLPLLVRKGWNGSIFATPATMQMTGLILRDAARLQLQDNERENRKRARAGMDPVEPLFTQENVESVLRLLREVPYGQPVPVAPGIEGLWIESGHMLGSASIRLCVNEHGTERRVAFSGDLGPRGIPILRDFETFRRADTVVLESTYGDRDHRPFNETVEEFIRIVATAVRSGGKILVPTFAVGRAQLLTTLLAWMFRTGKVPPFPVFLDSPMAIEAVHIYAQHRKLFDEQMLEFIRERPLTEDLKTLSMTVSADESRSINNQKGPCLVMAGAGMCNAGRILHHLRNNVWKPETHVVIVGYQSQGSLGRRLVEGDKEVKIFGERVTVRAQVHTLGGFSAHAGQTDLLSWFRPLAAAKPRVVLTHGEDGPRTALSEMIRREHRLTCLLPSLGERLQI
jgi:metallo-beta-lactamase family protein